MRSTPFNLAHNPRFNIWTDPTTGYRTSGKTGCARWKIERTDANDLLTVTRGHNSFSSKYDKWLRGEPHMKIDVTGLATNSTLRIRQFQELAEDFGENNVAMTVIASGPAGATFYFGIGDSYVQIKTLGDTSESFSYTQSGTTITVTRSGHGYITGEIVPLDFTTGTATDGDYTITSHTDTTFTVESGTSATTSGTGAIKAPILVTGNAVMQFPDPSQEYMRITPFESPSTTGVFRLHFVSATVGIEGAMASSELEIRPIWEEWRLISRYLTPITKGMLCTGAGSTSLRVPVQAPPGGWRVAPSIAPEGRAATLTAHLQSSGADFTAASPTFSISASPVADTLGCVVGLGGFSSLTSGSAYVTGGNPDEVICYLNADYF